MRVLRDKLWAKLTALVLFVLLGFLALLRTAQLFSNYMPGDEVGGRVLFIAVCAAGCLVCLVFSLSSAGHWAEHELSLIHILLAQGRLHVSVLHSADRWFGMTYHEDRETVAAELRRLHETGVYPAKL